MKQILRAVHIYAAPLAIYRAVTTKAGLSQWWTTRVEADEREGAVIRFTFAGDFHPQMRQTAGYRSGAIAAEAMPISRALTRAATLASTPTRR